mgnify:CR=1 FL=1
MKDSFEIALAGFARVDGDIAAEHGGFGHRADMRFFDPDIAEFGGDTQVVVDVPDRIDGQLGGIMKLYRDWQISGDREWLATPSF